MALIQMRDVPDHIYRLLEKQAESERRSLSQQAIMALARGLNAGIDGKTRRRNIIRALRDTPIAAPGKLTDPARLIRKDRQR